ncbi:OFA family MFS transporter [Candidatus Bathyarchaeota archaeon]|nr:OFA family MFS transporter [Candidatus Bathyarchaeota archaeon]
MERFSKDSEECRIGSPSLPIPSALAYGKSKGKVGGSFRWLIVASAIIIQLCLGAVYAFSILVPPLEAEFGWKRIETSPAFTIALLVFSISMIPAGRLQDRKGPKLVATAGGVILGLGMVLSSFTHSLPWLYMSYGVIGGLGIGLTYVTPITTCVKWFPEKKGLISGLAVFGFGAGSIVFAPFWTFIIEVMGWRNTFLITGLLFTGFLLPSAQVLRNPPEDFKPSTPKPSSQLPVAKDFYPSELLKKPSFYAVWISYWFGTSAGLMLIGHAKQITMELTRLNDLEASLTVSILGMFNSFGRILWGFLGDRMRREKVLALVFVLCFGGLFLAASFSGFVPLFLLGIVLTGLSFGGFLALYPTITSDYYGTKNLGTNYGIIFLAYGAGAILGPIMAGYFRTFFNSYIPSIYLAATLAIIGAFLALFLRRLHP